MSQITFDKFDLGIDLRKGASVSDANRLREMKNSYVTTGLATQKRPGLTKVADLEPGTKGLFSAFGKLNTFYEGGSSTHGTYVNIRHRNELFNAISLSANYSQNQIQEGASTTIKSIPFADVFNGRIYCAVEFGDKVVKHYYLDSNVYPINTTNSPSTKSAIKIASKIFAVGSGSGDVVRYSKTGDPRDWSSANDAGFLPTGLNSRGDRSANALGIYKNNLVVLSKDGAQVWSVDPDPANMKLESIVENVGTRFPRSVANVAGDLYFLSDYGFRSITTLQLTNNLADVDVGSPIDSLVREAIKVPGVEPKAFFFYGTGQYICAIGNQLFVYSISRTARIAAWSRYVIPGNVDSFAELGQELYIRSGDTVYKLDPSAGTDDGSEFEVLIELPYMDFKSPGQLKQIYGVDLVMEGQCEFSIGFDVRKPSWYTTPVKIKGNSRPGGMIPVEASGTEFSLRFRNYDDKPFRLDSVTVYYNVLGSM